MLPVCESLCSPLGYQGDCGTITVLVFKQHLCGGLIHSTYIFTPIHLLMPAKCHLPSAQEEKGKSDILREKLLFWYIVIIVPFYYSLLVIPYCAYL